MSDCRGLTTSLTPKGSQGILEILLQQLEIKGKEDKVQPSSTSLEFQGDKSPTF